MNAFATGYLLLFVPAISNDQFICGLLHEGDLNNDKIRRLLHQVIANQRMEIFIGRARGVSLGRFIPAAHLDKIFTERVLLKKCELHRGSSCRLVFEVFPAGFRQPVISQDMETWGGALQKHGSPPVLQYHVHSETTIYANTTVPDLFAWLMMQNHSWYCWYRTPLKYPISCKMQQGSFLHHSHPAWQNDACTICSSCVVTFSHLLPIFIQQDKYHLQFCPLDACMFISFSGFFKDFHQNNIVCINCLRKHYVIVIPEAHPETSCLVEGPGF